MKYKLLLVFSLFCSGYLFPQKVHEDARFINSTDQTGISVVDSSQNSDLGNHMVFVDLLQLFFRQATLGYEYFIPSKDISIRIPFTFGVNKVYKELGAELKFYITESGTFYRKIGPYDAGDANVRYFLGPAASWISSAGDKIVSLRFSNGVSMQFVKGLNLSAYGSVGPARYFTDNNLTNANGKGDIFVYWAINGTVGWRF